MEYLKGQKIKIPRSVRPVLETLIGMREEMHNQAFRAIAERFGIKAVDIQNNKYMFRVDRNAWTAYCTLTEDKEQKPVKEPIPYEEMAGAIAKLELCDRINPLVVHVVNVSVQNAVDYLWTFKPETMEIEISNKKKPPVPENIDLSQVQNSGGVQ